MRILDKNTDFYDYLQNVYRDDSVTFDRTDSFILTKEIMLDRLRVRRRYPLWKNDIEHFNFVLLQICNTFWLFLVDITKISDYDRPLDYTIELMTTWKNYNKPRCLIKLDIIKVDWDVEHLWNKLTSSYDKSSVFKCTDAIQQAVDTSNYEVVTGINYHTIINGDGTRVEKHIPLLKASGIPKCIEALDVFLAFEEYFSLEKTSSERIYSKGLTDKEKVENHGFDVKTSFRGK